MLAIEASGITKKYKGSNHEALSALSLSVEAGKVFTLLGRNGAGKTTFTRICATQLLPSSGTVTVLGHNAVTEANQIRNRISIVPQEGRPLRALTPWDHVYNWLQIRGLDKRECRRRSTEILERLELYEAKDVPAMKLSGGMKQKILVAMAIATDSELLFLDEPTIGLDPVSRRQVWSAIEDWKKRGGTIFLTTHYMDEAEMLSDRIAIVDRGKLVVEGTLHELRKVIPHNVRVDLAKDVINTDILKTFGHVVETGVGTLRVFTEESTIREISELAIQKNQPFNVSPITLDDVFVSLVKSSAQDYGDPELENEKIDEDKGVELENRSRKITRRI